MRDAPGISSGTVPVWLIVVSAATSAAVVMGLRQAMGFYVIPVTADLGVTREAFGLSIAFASIIWGLAAPVLGAISDHYGARLVVPAGLLATVCGLLTLQIAANDDLLLLSGVFLGLGLAGAGIGAAVGPVARAVAPEDRASAIAALGLGSAIGIVVMLPLTHLLIFRLGWKGSLSVLAGVMLAALPLALLVKDRPEPAPSRNGEDFVTALSQAFAHPSFWLINASFLICGFHVTFFGTYLPSFVADLGLPASAAVMALVMVGLGNLVGTYAAGECARIMPTRAALRMVYLGRVLVFLGFVLLPITSTTIIVLSGLLGFLWLSTVPLTSMQVLNIYGTRWTTMLFGVVFFSHQVGAFLGSWLGGLIFDRFKSYDVMWWFSIGLALLAALLQSPIAERPAEDKPLDREPQGA